MTAARSERVTTLELFFDLVFVLALTQLTQLFEHDPTWAGSGRVVLVFGVLWYMYGGYAWLTNHVSPTTVGQRVLLLLAMAGFLVTAVATPHVFDDTGVLFGVGYLGVIGVHLLLFMEAGVPGVKRLAPFNLVSAGFVFGAGFLDAPLQYVAFAAAIAVQVATPYLGVAPRFDLRAPHFVERHGLLVIVALGESVVAIGLGIGLDLTAGDALLVVLALALPAALWWTYFSGDEVAAERTLAGIPHGRRELLAIRVYYYAHIPILLGIVGAAAGIHHTLADPSHRMDAGWAIALAGGVTLFLLGRIEHRRMLRIGPVRWCAVTTVVVAATVALGMYISAVVQLIALIVIIAVMNAVEEKLSVEPLADMEL